MDFMTLSNGYEIDSLIFKKYNNDLINKRNKKQYFSSIFMGISNSKAIKLP